MVINLINELIKIQIRNENLLRQILKSAIVNWGSSVNKVIVALSATIAIASIISIQRSNSIQLVDSVAEATAQQTSAWLDGQKATIKELGVALEAAKNTDLHNGADLLHESREENPYALNYYYCSADAAVSEYGEDMDLIPSERGWWIQAFETGDTVIVDPYTDIATGKTIISACYLFYVDGKPFAVLADIDVTTVLEIINQIEEKQFCEGFLLSASGDVITHKNSEWLPTDEGSTNLSEALHTDLQSAVTIRDYDVMQEMASTYLKDAGFYTDASATLGAQSEELSASTQSIADTAESISRAQNLSELQNASGKIDEAVQRTSKEADLLHDAVEQFKL